MAVSLGRETLTAPRGAINRVAPDNNSCQALPPRSPLRFLRRLNKRVRGRAARGGGQEAVPARAASFGTLKVGPARH